MADELAAVADAPIETPVDAAPVEPVQDAPVDDTGAAPVDSNEAMWGDLKADEPAAPEASALPEEVSRALGLSEYVKEPAHIEAAVRTASEVWDVVTGKGTAAGMLEGMRLQNPAQYEKTVREDLIPYIEKITGQKFGAAAEASPDPLQTLQQELAELKQRPLLEAQQREAQQTQQRADTATGQHVETLIKSGNGIFDGDVNGAIGAMAAQLPKLGITPDALMKQVLSGNMANVEKAYKAAEKAETLRVKQMSDRVRARYNTLKGAVPASKGAPAAARTGGETEFDMTTQSGRVRAMTAEWNKGA